MTHTHRALGAALLLAGLAAPADAQETRPGWVAARYEISLPEDADAWQYASIESGVRRVGLTPIARVNWASRFDENALQLEADLYPSMPGVGYLYLSAAGSEGTPFPELRLAAEAFASLPRAFEASAGVIHMRFDADDVTVVVGSVSRYAGNYWLAVRPGWVTGDGDYSVSLIARRYFRSPAEFATLRLIAGSTPEEIARGIGTASAGIGTLGISADAQLVMGERWLMLPVLSFVSEEAASDDRRLRPGAGVGLMYRF